MVSQVPDSLLNRQEKNMANDNPNLVILQDDSNKNAPIVAVIGGTPSQTAEQAELVQKELPDTYKKV
jgi:hypothetical protein